MDSEIVEIERQLREANGNIFKLIKILGRYNIDGGDDVETAANEIEGLIRKHIEKKKTLKDELQQNQVEMKERLTGYGETLKENLQKIKAGQTDCQALFTSSIKELSDLSAFEKCQIQLSVHNYKDEMIRKVMKLKKGGLRILISGEMCAGKSSILNLIMGGRYMPVGSGRCTFIPCEITHSTTRKAILKYTDKSDVEIPLPVDDLNIIWKYIRYFVEEGEVPDDHIGCSSSDSSGEYSDSSQGQPTIETLRLNVARLSTMSKGSQSEDDEITSVDVGSCMGMDGNHTTTVTDPDNGSRMPDEHEADEKEASCTTPKQTGRSRQPNENRTSTKNVTVLYHRDQDKLESNYRDGNESTDPEEGGFENEKEDDVSIGRQSQGSDSDIPAGKLEKIVIHWPIPFLPELNEPLTFVDLPGIYDTDETFDTIRSYLHDADAFLFVINNSENDGVSKDRVVRLMSMIKECFEQKNGMFGPTCAMFICNKWGRLETRKRPKLRHEIHTKLCQAWSGISLDQLKTFEGSTEVFDRVGTDFCELFESLCTFVTRAARLKVETHCLWLLNLLETTFAIMKNAKQVVDYSRHQRKAVLQDLAKLKTSIDETIKETDITEKTMNCTLDVREKEMVEFLQSLLGEEKERIKKGNDCSVLRHPIDLTTDILPRSHASIDKIDNDIATNIRHHPLIIKQKEENEADLEKIISKYALLERKMAAPKFFVEDKGGQRTNFNILIPMADKIRIFNRISFTSSIIPQSLPKAKLECLRKDPKEFKRLRAIDFIDTCLQQKATLAEAVVNESRINMHSTLDYIRESLKTNRKAVKALENEITSEKKIPDNQDSMERNIDKIIRCLTKHKLIPEILDNKLSLKDLSNEHLIASGSYGVVYEANMEQREVAVKVVRFPNRPDGFPDDMAFLLRELILLRILSLKAEEERVNVVEYLGYRIDESDHDIFKMILAFELCNGTLDDLKQNSHLVVPALGGGTKEVAFPGKARSKDESREGDGCRFVLNLALQAARGVRSFHKNNILHRDIKPQNFLTNTTADGYVVVKLCDLGLARVSNQVATVRGIGTHLYNPPEVNRPGKINNHGSDIYSLALVIWELWYGQTVYEGLSDVDIQREKPPPELIHNKPPDKLAEMLRQCWKPLPAERPSADELVMCLEELTKIYPLRHGFI